MELHNWSRVVSPVIGETHSVTSMFYVYDLPRSQNDQAIKIAAAEGERRLKADDYIASEVDGDADIDFVDDALLNPAPHNAIEQQLLRGDMVGLALMSGAILWSAMSAFG